MTDAAFRADRYVLVERIGVGGMAEAFLARAYGPHGETNVVLKRILPHLSESAEFRAMFTDEARLGAMLVHPNIVRQLDVGVIDDQLFLAFELVEGGDLQKILARGRALQMQLSIEAALYVTCELLAALDYAHRATDPAGKHLAIVHRDVSPANLLVGRNGEVKLADFGVAKAAVRASVTTAGVIKGNYRYMPPEQVSGRRVDHRADLYAAGMVLLTLLVGKHPYEDEPLPAILDRVIAGAIPKPTDIDPHLPRGFDELVGKALAVDPEHRWRSAAEFRTACERVWDPAKIASGRRDLVEFLRDALTGSFVAAGERIPSIVARIGPLIADAVRAGGKGRAGSVFVSTGARNAPAPARAAETRPAPPAAAPAEPVALVPSPIGAHRQTAAAVVVARDGRRALSAGHDGVAKVWDLELARELRTLKGHRGAVTSLAITPDGAMALTGARDKTIRAWHVEAGEPITVLEGHAGWVFSVALGRNGSLAVSGSFDRTIRVWDVTAGKALRVLEGHTDAVACVALSLDATKILSAGYDRTLRAWDVETGAELARIQETDSLRACAFAPDGTRALSGGAEGLVRLWDLETGTAIRTMVGHQEPVVAVAFSADGHSALSCSYDGTVRVWSVDRGSPLRVVETGSAAMGAAFLAGDPTSLLAATSDGGVTLWRRER